MHLAWCSGNELIDWLIDHLVGNAHVQLLMGKRYGCGYGCVEWDGHVSLKEILQRNPFLNLSIFCEKRKRFHARMFVEYLRVCACACVCTCAWTYMWLFISFFEARKFGCVEENVHVQVARDSHVTQTKAHAQNAEKSDTDCKNNKLRSWKKYLISIWGDQSFSLEMKWNQNICLRSKVLNDHKGWECAKNELQGNIRFLCWRHSRRIVWKSEKYGQENIYQHIEQIECVSRSRNEYTSCCCGGGGGVCVTHRNCISGLYLRHVVMSHQLVDGTQPYHTRLVVMACAVLQGCIWITLMNGGRKGKDSTPQTTHNPQKTHHKQKTPPNNHNNNTPSYIHMQKKRQWVKWKYWQRTIEKVGHKINTQ